jgi:hypothetical protein
MKKAFAHKREAIWFVIFALFALIEFGFEHYYTFTGDSLSKAVQTESLIQSGFRSEELHYVSKDIDPEYAYYPFRGVYLIDTGARHLGQYPVIFSLISAPVMSLLGPKALPLFSNIPLLLLILILSRYWKLGGLMLLFTVACTPFILYGLEFSEHNLFVLLCFFGYTLFLHPAADFRKSHFWGGLLMGLSIWLRLEGMLFFFSVLAAILIHHLTKKELQIRRIPDLSHRYVWMGGGFSIAFFAFLLFNYLDYGNLLGTRFIANQQVLEFSWARKFYQMFVLFFFGYYKLGFFGYMPLLLLALIAAFRKSHFSLLDDGERQVLYTTLIYIPLVAFSAHSESTVSWGARYLALGIPVCLIIADRFVKSPANRSDMPGRILRGTIYSSILFSFLMTLLGIAFLKTASRQLKIVQNEFRATDGDLRLFSSPTLVQHIGLDYLNGRVMLAQNTAALELLIPELKKGLPGKKLVFHELNVDLERIQAEYEDKDQRGTNSPNREKGGNWLKSITTNVTVEGSSEEDRALYRNLLEKSFRILKKVDLKHTRATVYEI